MGACQAASRRAGKNLCLDRRTGKARPRESFGGGSAMNMAVPELEVLLPVHNEAESIEATIRAIHAELSKRIAVGFIICEDGSQDETKPILRRLSQKLPLRLNLSDARKGYSR